MTGQTILHYTILEKLGEGGMGVVYKAHDTKLDRMVALKFLPERLSSSDPDKMRFVQEARAASALNHPNVCTIHDIQEHSGQMFIVMEYVEGLTIRKKFDAGPMSLNDVAAYGIQIGEALGEAHAKAIVHRDIKADNIMINTKNQVKVMDFGLAKLRGSLKLTKTSSTIGTLAYMAPEQIQGGEVDSRSDIFAFGVLLFEMLTCQTPFRGGHEAAMVYSIVNEEPEPLEKYRPELPPILASIIARMLEKNPDDRHQSVGEIVIELRRLLKQSSKVLSGTHPVPADLRPTKEAPPERSLRRMLLFVAGGLLAVAAVVLAYLMFVKKEGASAPSFSFQSMKITRLTANGKTLRAVISPDGKYVVYSMLDAGKQSLWVRQVATGSNVQILPPDEASYEGLTISNDGNYLYYVVQTQRNQLNALYRVPVLGGPPTKITQDVRGAVSFSPDGKRLAFNRVYAATGDFSVVTANADGSGTRILATHAGDRFFEGEPSWSPDGSMIAASLGSWQGGYHFEVIGVNVSDGKEKRLTERRWLTISRLRWLPDGTNMLVTGLEAGTTIAQVWQLETTSGKVSRLTNDLNSYSDVALSGDGKAISVVQADRTSNIFILPQGDAGRAQQVTHGKENGVAGISWTPDGKLVYSSTESGNEDVWITDSSGSNRRQLTADSSADNQASVSYDGTFVLFTSWRTGIPNIWKMDIDGSHLKQLTEGGEDYNPSIAPDGSWFVFSSWDAGPIFPMKASISGGAPVRIDTMVGREPMISPDAQYIAYTSGRQVVRVLSTADGTFTRTLQLPPFTARVLRWTRDGKGISYIDTRDGVSNVWIQPLDGSTPVQVTSYTSDLLSGHAWSPDGTRLAVSRSTDVSDVLLMTNEQ